MSEGKSINKPRENARITNIANFLVNIGFDEDDYHTLKTQLHYNFTGTLEEIKHELDAEKLDRLNCILNS